MTEAVKRIQCRLCGIREKRVRCDICGKNMTIDDARIWWLAIPNESVPRYWVAHNWHQCRDAPRVMKEAANGMSALLCDDSAVAFVRELSLKAREYRFSGEQVAKIVMRIWPAFGGGDDQR